MLNGHSPWLRIARAGVLLAAAAPLGPPARAQGAPGFTEVTAAAGLTFQFNPSTDTPNAAELAGGTEGDFNGDGWPDLFLLGGGLNGDALFLNNGDGTFTNDAVAAGLTLKHRGSGAAAADYDDDGDVDIYVTTFGNVPGPVANGMHKLFRNNGDGTFTDVAAAVGVNSTGPTKDGYGATWGDYDLDGDLDLYVAGWFLVSSGPDHNRLFRNNLAETGTADFTDVTTALGLFLGPTTRSFGGIWADMDGDRFPELLVAGDFGTARYYRNNAGASFTNINFTVTGDTKVWNGMGHNVGDFDRDGQLDWFITAIYPATSFMGPPGNRLYMNQGGHKYQSLPESAGVNDGGYGWGSATIDFDHDGWQDLVMTNGHPACDPVTLECFYDEPSYLFRNNGDETFTEVHAEMNLINHYQGRALITLDYDRDGDLDVVITSSPLKNAADPPDTGNVRLYRNGICNAGGPAPGANWLEVALDTTADADLAPHGLGADVRVLAGGVTQRYHINAGNNYLCRSQLIAHFGLGGAPVVDQLTVSWPNGDSSVLTGLSANQALSVSSTALTWELLGNAKAGSAGLPQLAGSGPLTGGSLDQLDLTKAPASASATLIVGLAELDAAFKGGVLVPSVTVLVPLGTGATGEASLPFVLPAGLPAGLSLYFQFWISDAGASFGLSASNGLRGVTG